MGLRALCDTGLLCVALKVEIHSQFVVSVAACRQVAAVRSLGEQELIQCVAFDQTGSFVGR